MDKADIRIFRDILLTIFDEQKSDWSEETRKGRKPTSKARAFYELYSNNIWHAISREKLEALLGKNDEKLDINFASEKAVLFLPPLVERNSEFVPILNLSCKISSTINAIRLYVLLVRLDDSTQKPYGLGFRFDSPKKEHYEGFQESNVGEGEHDFYHVQIIRRFDYGPDIDIPDWLPDHQPSFPLIADDPASLLLALLLTLYGKKYCWEFYQNHASNLIGLHSQFNKLHPCRKCQGIAGKKRKAKWKAG